MIADAAIKRLIQQALKEDIGPKDITSNAVMHRAKKGKFVMLTKQECVVCGLSIAEVVFETVDSTIHFKPLVNDGTKAVKGKALAYIDGGCQSVLAAERTALNFISWLSGISTLTNKFVEAVKGTRAKVLDTRKTIPTLRRLQKYAVRIGGGTNHRMGLYDQVLIKDNHLEALMAEPTIVKDTRSAIENALKSAKMNAGRGKKIEIEVTSLDMLKAALKHNPDIIMLDNMSVGKIGEAVRIRDAHRIRVGDVGFKVLLEVSGNVTLENVKEIADCGVDRISIGSLTHSAPSVDISLEAR
ncbi:MAG: carboxylating nicotinate-nucleotide diphosphorylase [Candidatus Omnitrophica bacterium]|nr:carboxylating nicotinate-nucleotide diphosphorylase [Candidatus Omnitrophota bacterium]